MDRWISKWMEGWMDGQIDKEELESAFSLHESNFPDFTNWSGAWPPWLLVST